MKQRSIQCGYVPAPGIGFKPLSVPPGYRLIDQFGFGLRKGQAAC